MNMPQKTIYNNKNKNYFTAEKTLFISVTSFVIKGELFFLKCWNKNLPKHKKLFIITAL